MQSNIIWNSLNVEEWEQRFHAISRSNLLQSYDYARAICPLYKQKARWGLITIEGQEAGLVQMLEAGILANSFHALMIDRGPLWYDGYGSEDNFASFLEMLNRKFPKRFGRKRRIISEIQKSDTIDETLRVNNFTLNNADYQTLWIDLKQDLETLRSNLKKNWRGSLQKAEKENLTIEWDDTGKYLSWFLQQYMIDRAQKSYDGPSVKIIQALAKIFIPKKNFLIGRVFSQDCPISAVLILKHGSCATYQIGWTGQTGREKGAGQLLLWNAIQVLKEKGVRALDLGGVNDETAKGIKQFKQGMGGELITLPGLYI